MTFAPSMQQILYVGNEPVLSKASSSVLRTAGYRVRSTNPRNLLEVVSNNQFCVVVLCATLSNEESHAVVDALTQANMQARIVSLQVGLLGDLPHPASSVVVDARQGPQALVGAVELVTQQRRRAA